MNKQEFFYEDNLARLIRASFDYPTRPDASMHQRGWEKVKPIWEAEHTVAQKQTINKNNNRTNTFMSQLLKKRWSFGLGALGVAAMAVIMLALFYPPAQSKAATVMARGAQAIANLTSIHLRGQVRTIPKENFSYINADSDFCTIELWKEFTPTLKWKVEKPGRLVLMAGKSVVLYVKPPFNQAAKMELKAPVNDAFDTYWLHQIADISDNLERELGRVKKNGWKMDYAEKTDSDGKLKSVVTVYAMSKVPQGEYARDSFFNSADTRRVYSFDVQSERLESVQIFQVFTNREVLVFDLNQIDYNPAIDPAVWQLDLPTNVAWAQMPQQLQKLPDNAKYESMSPEDVARDFFEACGRKDWQEVEKFMSPIDERMKGILGGLEIVSIGKAFTTSTYPGVFVPYEIRLPFTPQTFYARLDNNNAAKRYVFTATYDSQLKEQVDSQNWTTEPAVLPDNDTYAKMSPVEVARATFDAGSKLDFAEMRKYFPESEVKNMERQVEAAKKNGVDVKSQIPICQVDGEAIWSTNYSAWFVKFTMTANPNATRKSNLAIRKDNPAKRWQFDGGL